MSVETVIENNPNGSTTTLKVIRGVTFGTINFKSAKPHYMKPDQKIFSTEFFVDKPTYKELKKTYKKMAIKELENDEVLSKLKIAAPFPEQDEQYKISMNAAAQRKNHKTGETMDLWKEEFMNLDTRPKVYDKTTGENITSSFYLSGGCVGDIYFTESNNDYGLFTYVRKIELDTVIPYVKEEQPSV